MNLPEIAEVWRRGSVIGSWLLDLTAEAFHKNPELDTYGGRVSDSGEGRWTVQAAIEVDLLDAIFWTPSTATFLRESLLEDSDWAVVVDQLSESPRPLGKLGACRTGETSCQREMKIPV